MTPDRVALFSYAHVPWLRKQQGALAMSLARGHGEIPHLLHRRSKSSCDAGYQYIGMDHFAKPDDELAVAQRQRTLHRNFQGYTTKAGADLYGMGVSAISAIGSSYAQNYRELPRYTEAVERRGIATMRGYRLSEDDLLRRTLITRLLCHAVIRKDEIAREFGIDFDDYFAPELARLAPFVDDRLDRAARQRNSRDAAGPHLHSQRGHDLRSLPRKAAPRRTAALLENALAPSASPVATAPKILVIGGGISGLACAWRLQQAGLRRASCSNAAARFGGVIDTVEKDGFLFDIGPQSFTNTKALSALIEELGLGGELLRADPRAPRYILKGGRLVPAPLAPPQLLLHSVAGREDQAAPSLRALWPHPAARHGRVRCRIRPPKIRPGPARQSGRLRLSPASTPAILKN